MSKARILVIEDDPDVRDTVCGALESLFPGAGITALAEGNEFLKVFREPASWDLVVVDIMLPDLSGAEICRRIRSHRDGGSVPVLAMSGYDTPEMEQKVRESGATDYLAKPFEISDFLGVVRKITASWPEDLR